MPQDFSGKNLRSHNFQGQNLTGAKFIGADIRGANFTVEACSKFFPAIGTLLLLP